MHKLFRLVRSKLWKSLPCSNKLFFHAFYFHSYFSHQITVMKKLLPLFACLLSASCFCQFILRGEARQGLFLQLFRNKTYLGSATGFIIQSPTRHYLVTNYHVVTGKNPSTKKWAGANSVAPNRVAIFQNAKEEGKYFVKFENLFTKKGKKRWIENVVVTKGKKTLLDVVELPLKDTADIILFPVSFSDSIEYGYKDSIAIQSFPKALRAAQPSPAHASGMVNADVALSSTAEFIVWLSQRELNEMTGSPLYVFKNPSPTMADSQGLFVGMFSKMPGVASTLIKSSFLRKRFAALP